MSLDRIDFEIITALQNDARLTNKELAAKIGLAPSSCLQRVRDLRQQEILRGFHAEVSPETMGINLQALIAVRLTQTSRDAYRNLRAHLLTLPEVLAIFHVSGAYDLQMHVAVAGINHLRDLIVDRIATRKEVDRCETSVIYSFHRNPILPCFDPQVQPKSKGTVAKRSRTKESAKDTVTMN